MAVCLHTMAALNRCALPLLALAFALGGCSSVQEVMGVERPGYQKDGTYVLSEQEQGLGCRELQERSLSLQGQMQQLSLQAVDQMQKLPTTMAAAWQRLVGSPGEGVPAVEEYNEARAESAALNATLVRKGCSSIETATIRR